MLLAQPAVHQPEPILPSSALKDRGTKAMHAVQSNQVVDGGHADGTRLGASGDAGRARNDRLGTQASSDKRRLYLHHHSKMLSTILYALYILIYGYTHILV